MVVAAARRRVRRPRAAFGRVAFAYTQHIIIYIVFIRVFVIIIYYAVLYSCGGKTHHVITYTLTHRTSTYARDRARKRILAVLLMIYTIQECCGPRDECRSVVTPHQWCRPVRGNLENQFPLKNLYSYS